MDGPVGWTRLERVRIAQLSDLHCDGTPAWAKNFQSVRDLLKRARPDLVLITGDCADHPLRKYYRQLHRELQDLQAELTAQAKRRIAICVIPGNHDFSFFGNQFPGLTRTKPFTEELERFIAGSGAVSNDLGQFAREHRIVVYPFDSNRSKIGRVAFARGRVDDPRQKFQQLAGEYMQLFGPGAEGWDECIHIALLHHHPLPLFDTISGQQLEQFHILDNAAEFLSAACEAGVHLILHGHKHVSGMAEYRYTGKSDNTHSVCVSACGTSAKVDVREREVCIFDVLRSGSVAVRRVRANNADPIFNFSEDDESREVIPYAFRRKRRARARENWPMPDARIKAMRTKTKVVRILENGRGYVKLTLDGLEWAGGNHHDGLILREFLHGGIGRVAGGWHVYRDGKGHKRSAVTKLPREQLTPHERESFEGLWFDLPKPASPDSPPSRFELRYVLHSGYFLCARDFNEAFRSDPQEPRTESSTIEVLVPTESAELIVNFPPNRVPDEDQIHLDAWVLAGGLPAQDIRVSHRSYEKDADETNYLLDRGAIRYRPEMNQVAVVIRHPQPSVAYTLRWTLPEIGPLIRRAELYDRFRHRLESLTVSHHAHMEDLIRKGLGRVDIRIYVFVYDPAEKCDEVSRIRLVQPSGQSCAAFVGRGIVGQCFRTRQLQYHTKFPTPGPNRRFTDSQVIPDGDSGDVLWVDSVLSEPLAPGLTEMLVIPLFGQLGKNVARVPEDLANALVAGVLLIGRYGGECEDSKANFFPFDLGVSEGRQAAAEMVKPLVWIVESVTMSEGGV